MHEFLQKTTKTCKYAQNKYAIFKLVFHETYLLSLKSLRSSNKNIHLHGNPASTHYI